MSNNQMICHSLWIMTWDFGKALRIRLAFITYETQGDAYLDLRVFLMLDRHNCAILGPSCYL